MAEMHLMFKFTENIIVKMYLTNKSGLKKFNDILSVEIWEIIWILALSFTGYLFYFVYVIENFNLYLNV